MTVQEQFDAAINEIVPMIGVKENVPQETLQKVTIPKSKEIPKGSIEEPPEEPNNKSTEPENSQEPQGQDGSQEPEDDKPIKTSGKEFDETQKLKEDYEKLKQKSAVYEKFMSDPIGYYEFLRGEAMKGLPQEDPYNVRIQKIYTKYGFNKENPIDPAEAFNNPSSDHAKCLEEINSEQSKEQIKQYQIQQNITTAARQQEEYIKRGNGHLLSVHEQLVKDYGATQEDYNKTLEEINTAQNVGDFYTLIANYYKYKIMAEKGLNKKIKTLSVEKQLEAAKSKEIPATPTGGKAKSTVMKDEEDLTDLLINYRDRTK